MQIINIDRRPTTIVTTYTVETESGDIILYTEYQDSDTLKVIDYEAEYETTTTLEPITDEMIEEIQKLVDEEVG
jgi:hypothetical protein